MTSFTLTSSQTMAEAYLRARLNTFDTLLVGGHSKGGNLAVYAAAMLPDELFDRIEHVYSNDGPGFCREVLSEDLIYDQIMTLRENAFTMLETATDILKERI